MDFIVTWSPQVRDDLHEIAAYIAKDSPRYASTVINRILVAGRKLEFLPVRGRIVPELGLDDHREIFVHEYRLIYRITIAQSKSWPSSTAGGYSATPGSENRSTRGSIIKENAGHKGKKRGHDVTLVSSLTKIRCGSDMNSVPIISLERRWLLGRIGCLDLRQ